MSYTQFSLSSSQIAIGFIAFGLLFPASLVLANEQAKAVETELAISWVRDSSSETGWEGAVTFGFSDELQLIFSGSQIRDTSEEPASTIDGIELEIEWWPIKLPHNIAAGGTITFSDGERSLPNEREFVLGLSWEPNAIRYQWEVGYSDSRIGAERSNAWGTTLSTESDLTERLELALEIGKVARQKPSIEVEAVYELTEPWKLVASVGRQSKETFGAIGLEYTW